MKKQALLQRIAKAARQRGLEWRLERQGAQHEVWRCGTASVSIPRHREINEHTAEGICRDLERDLGGDWWK